MRGSAMFSKKLLVTCMVVGLTAVATPAGAHGEIEGTDPVEGASLRRAPRSIAMTFSEAPTAEAALKVLDGCKRNVSQGVDVTDATATVRVATGQPGKWKVSYRVISALDGHLTRGSYSFTVAGKKDCTPDEEPTDAPRAGGTEAPSRDAGDDDDGGSGAPVVPIAVGAVVLVALALIVRRSGSG